jgi:CRISPR system Cascade subunit CasA
MKYDLRFESWLPFRRRSGQVEWLPPYNITDEPTGADPIVALACPRPDFDAAVTEFLIGLFTVALDVEDEAAWRKLRDAPPTPETLKAALANLPDAFALDGPGARAFQDIDPMTDAESNEIESLLIDAPGGQTTKFNKDLFVKRSLVPVLGRPAAAMALITMQTYAPSGGQGHRTSMRGGGPLTTLVEPRTNPKEQPLWQLVWANAETYRQRDQRDGDKAQEWEARHQFPWLSATLTSNEKQQGRPVRPPEAAPEQVYFGLPRRIRLDVTDAACVCALTGREDSASVTGFRMKNYGVQYLDWMHPLTPHYFDKNSGWLPSHGNADGVSWKDWQSLLFDTTDGATRRPAQTVSHFRAKRAGQKFRLIANGYDMDNMKARGWVQAELPGFPDESLNRIRAFAARVHAGTEELAKLLMFQVKAGLFERPKDAPGDFSHVKQALWTETQATFFDMVNKITDGTDAEIDALCQKFRAYLRDVALGIFDRLCPIDGAAIAQLRRPISARHSLVMTCEGYGKDGASFYKALQLEPPEKAKSKKGKAA